VFEASVMLGDALARLQRVDEAKPLLEAAIEHYSAEPPGPYNKLDYARTALASVLTAQHEERRAWELVRTVLDNLREHGADLHDEGVARELADFATMLFKQGRFAESEQVWREALVGLRDALGPRHEELVNALCNLGIAIKMQNRLDDAEPYYSEALAMAHELWSEPNETTGGLALNYGGLQEKRKDFEGAENAYREAADTFVRVLGPDSTKEAYARGNLAGMFARNGRCEEAEAMYAEVLPLQLRALPNSDPVPGFSHLNLAHCARERGEWAAAIEHYQRALDYWREAGSCEGYIARANAEMKELEAGVDDTAEKQ
jgi:tetratricopeptide (TPR) repeat protein